MLLFGMMFGDVGQGLVIALAGYLLSRRKGMEALEGGVYNEAADALLPYLYAHLATLNLSNLPANCSISCSIFLLVIRA